MSGISRPKSLCADVDRRAFVSYMSTGNGGCHEAYWSLLVSRQRDTVFLEA